MNAHKPELINALLDGELHGLQRWLVQRHVSQCPVCAAEFRRLHHVHDLLAGNQPVPALSDSPEFFWSKVKREIEHRGNQTVEVPAPAFHLGDWVRQHQMALATAGAFTLLVAVILWEQRGQPEPVAPQVALAPMPATQIAPPESVAAITPVEALPEASASIATEVEQVATDIPNTSATVLASDNSGDTVIWVTGLPWASDMDDLKTQYATMDIWG